MAKFSYEILLHKPNLIFIKDTSPQLGGMSITNAAELVIEDLLQKSLTSAGKRVIYQDTEGNIDELCHDGRKFTGFRPIDMAAL